MIRSLTGKVVVKNLPTLVIDVNGVGYEVFSTTLTAELDSNVTCAIYTVVKEDSITLYGFNDEQERGLFALVLSVNGVGPKSALTILGSMSVTEISQALTDSKPEPFTQVKGIGKKVAERLVLDLTGSINKKTSSDEALTVASALENLGYKQREYKALLSKLPEESIENQLSWILKELAK